MARRFLRRSWSREATALAVVATTSYGMLTAAHAAEAATVVTPERPAELVVESTAAESPVSAAQAKTITIDVVGFSPPENGSVQAVVKVETGVPGGEQEIGRFGLYPNSEFKAQDRADAQRFQFSLDSTVAKLVERMAKIRVDLVPYGGVGSGARLEIAGADIKSQ